MPHSVIIYRHSVKNKSKHIFLFGECWTLPRSLTTVTPGPKPVEAQSGRLPLFIKDYLN